MQQYVNEIKNLVSCPPKIYSQLYLTTLSHFIIHCPATILNERLMRTTAALKLRQGIFLPKNAGAEVIASEEAQWTYALFSACLLSGLQPDLIERVIPKVAESWLRKNIFLFAQWRNVLLNTMNNENDLAVIIRRAAEKF